MRRDGGLLGRDDELRQLGLLLGGAAAGRGGSLLVLGEPGIGKTALLKATTADAHEVLCLRLDGYEGEASIPFAAIHRLLIPLREQLGRLPQRQQDALLVAAGAATGPAPDRFLVGLGALGLLCAAAEARPVVCAVDDAHLVDPESLDVLAFVARRLEVEPVALLLAARDEGGVTERMGGVPQLVVPGLGVEPAVRLLAESLAESGAEPVDRAVAAQIARAAGGNPLALIDLAQDLSIRDLGHPGIEPIPVGRQLEAHYVQQARRATPPAQTWALLAAADTTGNVDLITGAATELGLPADAMDHAESAGLVELGALVRFRHPLVRSAVYNAASGADRRRAHRALAVAAEQIGLVEMEAWHASKATLGTDPAVADRLEHAADLAARRGGFASRASVLSRAAELTPPGLLRNTRLLAAAEAAVAAGAVQTAQGFLDRVDDRGFDRPAHGRILVVRSELGLFTADPDPRVHAAARLLDAAELFRGQDPGLEQRTLLQAVNSCMTAERAMQGVTHAALAARLHVGAAALDGPLAVVLRGLSAMIERPYDDAVPPARAALDEITRLPPHETTRLGTHIAVLSAFLWDERARSAALGRASDAARDAGALRDLDILLWVTSLAELNGGSVRHAVECTERVRELRRAMGYDAENVVNAAVLAWTGAPSDLIQAIADQTNVLGFAGAGNAAVAALGVRDLAEGAYGDAYDRLRPFVDDPFLHVTATQYADFTEAAARTGRLHEAEPFVDRLDELARANGSAWCRGVAARSRALLRPDTDAEGHFVDAINALAATGAEVELARAHLLHGEWLRRVKRRREAGDQLRLAVQHFERSGADMFLPRTRRELEATGARVDPARADDPHPALTAQEHTIAGLAATGHTNSEIAARLFVSPNTVDYHLRKVFQKLGVSSRRQLAGKVRAAAG